MDISMVLGNLSFIHSCTNSTTIYGTPRAGYSAENKTDGVICPLEAVRIEDSEGL